MVHSWRMIRTLLNGRRPSNARRIPILDIVTNSSYVVLATAWRRTGALPRTTPAMVPALAAAAAMVWTYSYSSLEESDYCPPSIITTTTTTTRLEEQRQQQSDDDEIDDPDTVIATPTKVLNWSGTHSVHVTHYYEPNTVADVERIVADCHARGQPVRPVGSALSPNGVAFHAAGMMSLANLDEIVSIDQGNADNTDPLHDYPTVTVQAGARVSQVVDALRPYHLTLPNLASIAEQQMGGFTQVGAHGTGRAIAPVDQYVTKLKLVTPSRGTLTLTEETHGELFHMAKVGLGCLGVVVEVTMQCIPAHSLREHTFVLTRQQAKDQVDALLKKHKHMRYMWIPYTDAVVCVTNDPVKKDASPFHLPAATTSVHEKKRLEPLTDLLIEVTTQSLEPMTAESVRGMGFGEIRDALLAIDPLNVRHVQRCNLAEAEFWKRSSGLTVKPSDELLQFDCGGQVRP